MILAAILGLYGIMWGCGPIVHLAKMEALDTLYSPLFCLGLRRDLKDT